MNISHESIRDLTMFSMLIFEKNLLNKKNLHWRKRRNVSEQYCLIKMNKLDELHLSPFYLFSSFTLTSA